MHNISLRAATSDDAAFALHVTEACIRVYAEQTWETGIVVLISILCLIVIQLAGRDIGLIGVDRRLDFWLLDKFYVFAGLPKTRRWQLSAARLDRG